MTPLSLDELATAFEACTLPKEQWTHLAHLRVGAWHVCRYGETTALDRLRRGIRRLNESYGGANSATAGYHETITAAHVRLIAVFLSTNLSDASLDARVEALLASHVAHRDALLVYWSKEVLMSERARAAWVDPDRQPLPTGLEATR